MSITKIQKEALALHGARSQAIKAIEEMAELITALTKDLNMSPSNVEEEIADVQIMMEQLKEVYDSKEIEKHRRRKLYRLKKRVENGVQTRLQIGVLQQA